MDRKTLSIEMMLHETIQPILAPVVLISACGLLIMAINARAMSATDRIRQLHHERLEIHGRAEQKMYATRTQRLRYEGVGHQSTNILRRLAYMRAALVCMACCVVLMLMSSLFVGLHSIADTPPWVAVIAFAMGLASMLVGSMIFVLELRLSLKEVSYEHMRLMLLELPDTAEPEHGERTSRDPCR